ncbi:glutamyl-tRNA reductase [Ruminococcus sp. OA3]|nr:glutamyl-tRNA reductase [Ruminococcus sp. OA3]MCH1983625.1 glutamyl-tRNA reductase [Ruminococcus sp. OA3]
MSICMVGIDHNKASVDVRALFSFTKKNAAAAMEELKSRDGILGCIILSTCNRMEIWASVEEEWEGSLVEELCIIKEVDPTQFGQYFVMRERNEAVNHLFHLTCGLKSQILGEDQIITQVKDALSLARENYMTDSVLEVLFRMAVTAAKKVKTDVTFSRANFTAMDRAVSMLKEQGYEIQGKTCMVIGNGEMGKLAAQTMQKAGAVVTVTVRQYRSGMVTIPKGCARINYGERMDLLPKCHVVVSATASPNFTLTRELLEEADLTHDIIFIDLAVPRDIEPAIGEMEHVTLYDIDDFQVTAVGDYLKDSFDQAEAILQEQQKEFYDWYDGRDLIPRIQEIQEDAVTDLELRIHKILGKLPLDDRERESLRQSIELAAGKVVGKMIFGLRDSLEKETFLACVEGLEKLYEE